MSFCDRAQDCKTAENDTAAAFHQETKRNPRYRDRRPAAYRFVCPKEPNVAVQSDLADRRQDRLPHAKSRPRFPRRYSPSIPNARSASMKEQLQKGRI